MKYTFRFVVTITTIVAIAFSLALMMSVRSEAQVAGATLSGSLMDPSGAAIPKGQVSIKNVGTNTTTNVRPNAQGLYLAPNLLAGTYEVTASAEGFATTTTTITLTVGGQQVVNLSMQVAKVATQVKVSDQSTDVDLASSAVGGVNDAATIRELPLNGRSWTDLAALQPGVNSLQGIQPSFDTRDRTVRGYGNQISISGARPQQSTYRLDGISVTDTGNGAPGSILGGSIGVDAIQEFSVLTSNYPAEYGRSSGGVVNAITKSGTNQIHGDAYEFLRNSALDARNYFDLNTIPPFKRNQFGASLGGPITKDRLFIFGDYEGLRQSLSISQIDVVPTAAARAGILSTGNVSVDSQAARFLNTFYPVPNGQIFGDTGIFAFPRAQNVEENYFTFRSDYYASSKDRFSGTYFHDGSNLNEVDEFANKTTHSVINRNFVSLEGNHIFRPNLLNAVRFGFYSNFVKAADNATAINPAAADPSFGFIPGESSGAVIIPGVTMFSGGLSAVPFTTEILKSWQVYDDLFYTAGKHSLEFGANVERSALNQIVPTFTSGFFIFGSLSDFLTNNPLALIADKPGFVTPRYTRQTIIGMYIQDDWRFRPNLTINLGLRYEPATVPHEIHGKQASLLHLTDALPHIGSPLIPNATTRNFEPRIGFVWDPFKTGKTAIRGGFGIYDVLPLPVSMGSSIITTYPFLQTVNAAPLFPGAFPTQAYAVGSASPNTQRIAYLDQHPHRNYVMQWNINVQRQIAPDLSAMVAYVGSHGVHMLYTGDDANIVFPTVTPQGYLWPSPVGSGQKVNPNVGRLPASVWDGSALYDALQTQVTKRMAHDFQIQGSFTWGRCIDDGSGTLAGDTFVNGISTLFLFYPRLNRGPCDFNIDRTFVLNYIWNIPTPTFASRVAKAALGGWQLGGIFTASDGLPFTPRMGGDPLGMNNTDPLDFPNRIQGAGCSSLVAPGNVNNYVKLQCFAAPNPLTMLGNAGRNSIPGPGLAELDLSAFKNNYITSISEHFNIQFRAELFNVLNRANFLAPIDNSSFFDQSGAPIPGAGAIDQTATTSRQIQLAIKVIW